MDSIFAWQGGNTQQARASGTVPPSLGSKGELLYPNESLAFFFLWQYIKMAIVGIRQVGNRAWCPRSYQT